MSLFPDLLNQRLLQPETDRKEGPDEEKNFDSRIKRVSQNRSGE